LTNTQKNIKRLFDLVLSFLLLVCLGWFVLFLALLSKLILKGSGFFKQSRIGQFGNAFTIYKIETIKKGRKEASLFGSFLRASKLDELPQLYNVLIGDMSFVGPRPDVAGFADLLKGKERSILELKPGITGPATIYFIREHELLMQQENAADYNKEIVWPKKVELNLQYLQNYSFQKDLTYLIRTIALIQRTS
jgi:lipopolysaccharide/colanic/teichoic acid biosynthesis glycosyltransferase